MKNFDLCNECGQRIPVNSAARPFKSSRLCASCVDDLFLTSSPVHFPPGRVKQVGTSRRPGAPSLTRGAIAHG